MTLAQWPGRGMTGALLERRGYLVPRRFEEFAFAFCPERTSLEKYWDEVALEYLCSAGRGSSNRRTVAATSYRSRYLDDLAAERVKRKQELDGFPLDSCLRDFKRMMLSSSKDGIPYLEWLETEMRTCKREEIEKLHISVGELTSTKKDFYGFVGAICEARGFQFQKKKWRKVFGPLEICCGVDAGMQTTWTFQLPLDLTICHAAEPDLFF